MSKLSIELLERLIELKGNAKTNRLTKFLRSPEDGVDSGWHMYVPSCFNESLDIKKTPRVFNLKDENGHFVRDNKGKIKKQTMLVWTQGSCFTFNLGDTIYDTPKAYEMWGGALKHIKRCITVKEAFPVIPASKNDPRSPGVVRFTLSVPDKFHTQLVETKTQTMTQDKFIKYLITGECLRREYATL